MGVVGAMDSGSGDENGRFSSAVDPEFDPFSKKSKPKKYKCESFNEGFTPGMQDYVAKHLAKRLEKSLVRTEFEVPKRWKSGNEEEFVRLFAESTKACEIRSESALNGFKVKRKKKRKVSSSSSDEDEAMKRFSSVAVDSEWVLKKKGVYEDGKCKDVNGEKE